MLKAGFELLTERTSTFDDWSHKFYWTQSFGSEEELEEKIRLIVDVRNNSVDDKPLTPRVKIKSLNYAKQELE